MRGNELLYKMELIDHAYVEAADRKKPKPKAKKSAWIKWISAAACLCLAITGAVILRRSSVPAPPKSHRITYSDEGVTIPKAEINLNADEMATADMMLLFIYDGRCYIEYDRSYADEALAGEYLGQANGLIDEWTPQDGYVDFAGSAYGDIYTVSGYDPSFMLCIKYPDDHIEPFICDNGITLKYGSELFEDRLHLSENLGTVEYETYDSWYHSRNERYELKDSESVISKLIAEIDSARFVPCEDIPLGKAKYHLYFKQKNGMTAELTLFENGYISLSSFTEFGNICVQVSEESYEAILGVIERES